MKNITAVFYDAGMTLIHPHPVVESACINVCNGMGLPVDIDSISRGLDHAWGFFFQALRDDNQLFSSDVAIKRMWIGFYYVALREARVSGDPNVLQECAEAVYQEYVGLERWLPFPEVEDTLMRLRERGYVQGVISDWGSNLIPILHGLGLTKYLDFVVGSADVRAAKPNRHIFELALKRAGVAPEEAIHVGDSYFTDVLGARAANVTPVFLDRNGSNRSVKVDCAAIGRLDELVGLLGPSAAEEQGSSTKR